MTTRTLDRTPSRPDPVRIERFAAAPLVEGLEPRSYTWRCDLWLDQGTEGACVGHGWTHEFAARPVVVPFPQAVPDGGGFPTRYEAQPFAFTFYEWCRRNDEWPGEDYDGTSVAAGAKGAKLLGLVPEYRWSHDADELAVIVSRRGPVVLGIDWWTGMFRPDGRGLLHLSGKVEGGHCLLLNGYSTRRGCSAFTTPGAGTGVWAGRR